MVRVSEQTLSTLGEIAAWSRVQFPGATVASTLRHIRKEVDEIERAIEAGDMEALAVEFADLIHLATQGIICAMPDADPDAVTRAKLAVNMDREWADPDEHGVVEHVRSDQSGREQ